MVDELTRCIQAIILDKSDLVLGSFSRKKAREKSSLATTSELLLAAGRGLFQGGLVTDSVSWQCLARGLTGL
jgi:hypothetical protein